MALDSMNVSLPQEMKGWVEQQAKSGRYSNASDYVRDLIRKDQDRTAKIANMQRLVDEARTGGVSNMSMDDILRTAQVEAGHAIQD